MKDFVHTYARHSWWDSMLSRLLVVVPLLSILCGMGVTAGAQISCESQCGINYGACATACGANNICQQQCTANYNTCLAGCATPIPTPCTSGCGPTPTPPPASGSLYPKFIVLSVIYAPPGQRSSVNYGGNETMGTTMSWGSVFTTKTSTSVSANGPIFGGSVSSAWTQTSDASGSMSVNSSSSSDLTVPGPTSSNAGINHEADVIAIWLNAKADFTWDNASASYRWKYGIDTRDPVIGMDVVYLHVYDLKRPGNLAGNTSLQRNWAGPGQGLTATDFGQILRANPFANGSPNVDAQTRFYAYATVPYTKPSCDSSGHPITQPITKSYTLNYSTAESRARSASSSYDVTFTASAAIQPFLKVQASQSFTWTNRSGTSVTSSSGQTARLSVTGPSDCSYQGDESIAVYQDNVYGTFMFAYLSQPTTLSRPLDELDSEPIAIVTPAPTPTATAPPPPNGGKNATVGVSVPATMVAGQDYTATFTLRNTGSVAWNPVGSGCNSFRLGAQNPQDNRTWGPRRLSLPNTVAPGASTTLTATITAPSTPGVYDFQWKMMQECVAWFGSSSANVAIAVNSLPTSTPIPGARDISDFNGDGQTDLLGQYTDGRVSGWQMSGPSTLSTAYIYPLSLPGWTIRGSGDFDADGATDIVAQHQNGTIVVWLMDGLALTSSSYVHAQPQDDWTVRGVADFNADGWPDILLQADDDRVRVWFMNGLVVQSRQNLAPTTAAWTLRGTGDFNADGQPDILCEHTDGHPQIWLMNGTAVASKVTPYSQPVAGRGIRGTGDFDGDGKTDILWQYGDGRIEYWRMDGTTFAGTGSVYNQALPGWKLRYSK
jgi:hypothetical protein